jgi:hypothetical protein
MIVVDWWSYSTRINRDHGTAVFGMIAKRVRADRAGTRMLAEVQWLTAHAAAVGDALAAAVP